MLRTNWRILRSRSKKEREIQETIHNIERKLERVNQKSKFRIRYLKEAKSKPINSKSDAALESVREAQRKIISKMNREEEKIENAVEQIQVLYNKDFGAWAKKAFDEVEKTVSMRVRKLWDPRFLWWRWSVPSRRPLMFAAN